jgi:hypothetical protein
MAWAVPVSAQVSAFQGEWREVDFDGVSSWDDGSCGAVYLTERVWNIFPPEGNSDKVVGTTATLKHGRLIFRKRPTCRLPETGDSTPAVYENMRFWQFVAHLEPGGRGLAVQGIFDDSKGDKCAKCNRDSFSTELTLEGGGLRDSFGTTDPADDIVFRREADRAARIDSGVQVARAFLQLISSSSCDEAYARVTSQWQATATRTAWTAECRKVSAAMGHVSSQTIQEKHFVSRVVDGKRYRSGEFVFLAVSVVSDKGSGLEFILLEKEANNWRIGLYYVS